MPPTIVFPKVADVIASPISALSAIRISLNQTGANFEAGLPQGGPSLPKSGGGTSFKLPDVLAFFKGPAAAQAVNQKTTEQPSAKTSKSVFNYK
jgi:hypothetical protein